MRRMAEERDKGRRKGHGTSRLGAEAWAWRLLPTLAEARAAIVEATGSPVITRAALARWLNENEVPTRRGGVWTSETIRRLLDIPIGLTSQAENDTQAEIRRIEARRKVATPEASEALWKEERAIRDDLKIRIIRIKRLHNALRGYAQPHAEDNGASDQVQSRLKLS